MNKPILLFGPTGQVGARLMTALEQAGYEVTGIDRARCDFLTADEKSVATIIRAVEPALIINAAAYTDVEVAESQPEEAHRVNAQMPALLASLAQACGILLLHFSTDYVFGGTGHAPYQEHTTTQPINVYGASKCIGEEAVLAAGGHVIRLQWIYDLTGRNFLNTMRKVFADRSEIRVVADQLGAPSSARDVAQAITQAVPLILSGQLKPAAYHLTARGFTSWHGFACAIAAAMKNPVRILPVTRGEYPQAAARPFDTRLDCSALAAHGITMPHWRDGLNAICEMIHADS